MKGFLAGLGQDTRYALRGMRRSPGFTAVAIGSLALGIGANTAIFSLIDTVILRMLPISHPDQLVELLEQYPGEPRGSYWSPKSYQYIRENNHVFSGVTGMSVDNRLPYTLEGFDQEFGVVEFVLGNYFPELGVKSVVGRMIAEGDENVAVVSWSLWNNRFHRDPGILGKRILTRGAPDRTIIGVAPPEFAGLRQEAGTDLWFAREPRDSGALTLIGRLKPGATIEQARAELNVLHKVTIEERAATSKDPNVRRVTAQVEAAGNGLSTVRDRFGMILLVLMSIVGLLLLLTCVNLAAMMLARGAAREREMSLRASLGASRGRLLQQVLTESLMLSLMGTIAGGVVAYWGTSALLRILASGRPHEQIFLRVEPDWRVLAFTGTVAVFAGVLFGLAPALSTFRSSAASALKESGRGGESRVRRLFGKSLVALQVALSVVLLSFAGLFVTHLRNLEHVDLGFRRDHVLLVSLDPSRSGYNGGRLSRLYQDVLERVGHVPGVRAASMSAPTPLSGAGASAWASADGFQERPEDRRRVSIAWAAPHYFETLGTPLLAGRDFRTESTRVAIVNQKFARYYFGAANPIGKQVTLDHITLDPEPRTFEIVGLAADANYYDIREPATRTIYLPAFQDGRVVGNNLVIRTGIEPASAAGGIRNAIHEVAPAIAITRVTTLDDQVDSTIVPERLIATLSGCFGLIGGVLVAIGLHGLLAYTVARRTGEIGIRMALGATSSNVTGMVLLDALGMVLTGLILGLPLAFAGQSLAVSVVPGLLTHSSVVPLGFGTFAIAAIGLVASYVPAMRAARVDPMEALRHD